MKFSAPGVGEAAGRTYQIAAGIVALGVVHQFLHEHFHIGCKKSQ
jgi:hypothetical protein